MKTVIQMLVIAGLSVLTGCTYTFEVPVDQIPRLSASAPRPHTVTTVRGITETVRNDATVTVLPKGTPEMTFEPPVSAEIQGENLLIRGKREAEAKQFPLRAIRPLKVKQISEGGGAAAVLGIVAGVSLIGLTIFGISYLSNAIGGH